ncbi:MAG: hypothetical protein Q8R02_01110 [Hyphomonadaceae bacterium]|nr:hypothetical protein [Hyphomonadaceae bacterium]
MWRFVCPACDDFFISDTAKEELDRNPKAKGWLPVTRSALAHLVRTRRDMPFWKDGARPFITSQTLERFYENQPTLPARFVQMDNAIRFFGDVERDFGNVPEKTPDGLWALVGTVNGGALGLLVQDMVDTGFLANETKVRSIDGGPTLILHARLSLKGWQRWEEIQLGATSSKDGFIAMQYGDERLDRFVNDVIRAGVRAALDIEVYRLDSPDKLEAGLIDNIMREAIEDAAFVLVELSHGNKGAYWEAGFAEGLRKPVIYLCEESVWNDPERKPHFDVNHRTTIMWSEAEPDKFVTTLVATIKNSLREKAG